MANLINPNQEASQETYNPTVHNQTIKANAPQWSLFVWYFSFLLIIPLIYHVVVSNRLNRNSLEINETISSIDVQLKKRSDTLVKLMDATKGYVKYEKSVLENVTKLRNVNITNQNRTEVDSQITSAFGRLLATAEAYPDLKADSLVQNTMSQASYLEQEIAAARRLFNAQVTAYNAQLVQFPSNIIATAKSLSSYALFAASVEDKKDVSLAF